MKRLFALLIALAALALPAHAQAVLATTTLAEAISSTSATAIRMTSVSDFSAGEVCYVDREAMYVVSVSGPMVNVTRGYSGTQATTHATGATVYVGAPSWFTTVDKSGTCSPNGQIFINTSNGNIFTCTAGAWVRSIPAAGYVTSLNGLTPSVQLFAVGTSGSDFAVSSATATHTFNLPDAGAAARGAVTTGTQTIAGAKTLTGNLTLANTAMTTTVNQASADADASDVIVQKSRGTIASPTVITTADELGNILFKGYSGAGGFVTGAAIKGISEGTIATTRVPAHLSFWTGTDAAPTVLTERMRIDKAGNVGIGTAAPSHLLQVAGSSSSIALSDSVGAGASLGSYVFRNTNSSGYDAARIVGYTESTIYQGVLGFDTKDVGGTMTERMRINSSGLVGIGTTAPEAALDINHASGDNLQLTYDDSNGSAANYVKFEVSSSGDLTLTPSGGDASAVGTIDASSYLTGLLNVVAKSDSYTIETDTGKDSRRTLFTQTGSGKTFTLPAATVGKVVMFGVRTNDYGFTVVRAGSDVLVDTAGDAYTQAVLANTQGTQLILECYETGKWTVGGTQGTVTLS